MSCQETSHTGITEQASWGEHVFEVPMFKTVHGGFSKEQQYHVNSNPNITIA